MKMAVGIAGKGGTGKTTLAALLVKYLCREGRVPILAIDADPNANLGEVLGLEVPDTVGDICEEMKSHKQSGVSKTEFLNLKLQTALSEGKGVDLLTMGRPEGSGCYCFANNLLRTSIDLLSTNYPYLVMDNEAGLEHLSRKTTRDLNCLLIVSDPTVRGVRAAARISQIVRQLEINVGREYLIINRLNTSLGQTLQKEIKNTGLPLLATVPEDDLIISYDQNGKSLSDLPGDSSAVQAAEKIGRDILLQV